MDFETTGQHLDQDVRNLQLSDPADLAARDALLAIATRKVFQDTDDLQVTVHAEHDEITVSIAVA